MLIEDTSEKLRRNLIVFSFLIFLFFFLNLKLKSQGAIFGILEYNLHSQLKSWLVVTVVLIYFFFRYWFDNDRVKQYELLLDELTGLKVRTCAFFLKRELKAAFLMNRESKFINNVELDDPLKQAYKKSGLPMKADVNLGFDENAKFKNYKEGLITISYAIYWKDGNFYSRSGGQQPKFKFSTKCFYVINLICLLRLCTLSKSNFESIIPITLFLIALFICLFQLIINY